MIDVSPWAGLDLVEPVDEGQRNEVWFARRGRDRLAVRRSRRGAASLEWELDLLDDLGDAGFIVPNVVRTDEGGRRHGDVVVQRWLDGRPPSSPEDWTAVAAELGRLHRVTQGRPQRPGCCAVTELAVDGVSVDADLGVLPPEVRSLVERVVATLGDVPTAVVHGDPGPSNIRLTPEGGVGLLDWDESRVDLTWHDLSNLGVQVLDGTSHRRAQLLSDAWEAANAWTVEPAYARRRLADLERRLDELPNAFDP